MKDRESVQVIWHYFRSMIGNAGKMTRGFAEESIHLFRVDVKKLRAFLRMLRTATDKPEQMKFPREFKKMYSTIGKIRDRQLFLKQFKEKIKADEISSCEKIHSVEKEIKDLSGKRSDFLTKRHLEEIEKNILAIPSIDSPGKRVKHFLKHKLKAINEIVVKDDFKDTDLHNIRKRIKDIIYIAGIFRDDLKKPIPFHFWNEDDLKKAERLSRKLGLFNDTCVSLTYLPVADIKKADHFEKEYLKIIRRKWLRKKARLKRTILNDLPVINRELAYRYS